MVPEQSRRDNLCMVTEMRMKGEGLLEKREIDLRKKVFYTICFSQYGVHHPNPNAWRAGMMMRIKAVIW